MGVIKRGQLATTSAMSTLIHQVFDGLLSSILRLHLVQRRVNHLAVDALEFSVSAKVNLNVVVLTQELANKLEEAEQSLVISCLFHVYVFGHNREVRLDEWSHLNLSLGLKLCHLGVVMKPVHVHEVVIQADVGDPFVVHKGLESNGAEVRQVNSALHVDLTVTPAKFKSQ